MRIPSHTHLASNKRTRRRIYEKNYCKNRIFGSSVSEWKLGLQFVSQYLCGKRLAMHTAGPVLGSVM